MTDSRIAPFLIGGGALNLIEQGCEEPFGVHGVGIDFLDLN
jgi:hypothetical protein